ncbi:MAG: Aspartyl/glutamyl-tRNA(Asn/Gln) amidotransferase subunit B [Gemmatimonadaceae bacterium]|nr:Aspartyl/glutamyl-tRNA(Asn/Gln) amidotransferase subunit B [Gemmatimonadaceae bacterium]
MTGDVWEVVIGLEVHVQLRTRTKAFCDCLTAFGGAPNTRTCPVCLALPGALPVLNGRAVELAATAALALGCTVHEESVFARKNYFYPDLPKGYQISQFDRPLATNGRVTFRGQDGQPRVVGIDRVHMEEDAGKSIHDRYPGLTAIDLNRAGTPLIEIVTAPDLRHSTDAGVFLRQLKRTVEYLDVSDANMEEGSLRVDANVSVRAKGAVEYGTKTEIKNMNSFSSVERAIDVEHARQSRILADGGRVRQETLLWDAARQDVRPARSKEESHDYRYFPDPDLPPLLLTPEWIATRRDALPELPNERRARFVAAYGLPETDAEVLTASRNVAEYFEQVARAHGDGKAAANWVVGEVQAALNTLGVDITHLPVTPESLASLLDMVRGGTISNTAAKRVFALMLTTAEAPRILAEREGLLLVNDDATLRQWVDAVCATSPDEIRRLRAGERKLLGVLVGQVMKTSGGRADPRKVSALLAAMATDTSAFKP